MKAIKIPNTSLLDVFGRPVATNTQDFRRFSVVERSFQNNHYEPNNKYSNGTNQAIKLDNSHRLTVIGLLQKKTFIFIIILFFLY